MTKKAKSDEEEAAGRLAYEAAVYREQLRLLQREMEKVTLTTIELDNAARTVEKLKIDDAFVPIGGGTFIKANIYSMHVLVPIGADYVVEMDKDAAVLELKKRIESTKKAVEKLKEEFANVSKKLNETGKKLKELKAAVEISKRTEESAESEYEYV